MLKFFTNLIFIVMLFMLLSGIPLNLDVLEINPFKTNVDVPLVVNTPNQYMLSENIDIDAVNPTQFSFDVLTSNSSTPDESFINSVNIILTQGDASENINTTRLNELSYDITQGQDLSVFTFTIALDSLIGDSSAGLYHLNIESSYETNTVTPRATFNIVDTGLAYLGTSNEEVSRMLTMTLYFPTADYKYLVPISRRVTYPENRSRTLYRNLDAGPLETIGLPSGKQLPYASRIYINSGVASIYIYSPEQEGYEEDFDLVVEAVTNSMTSLDFIESAVFYIDGKQITIGSTDLSETFLAEKNQIAYMGYHADTASDYLMLLPVHLTALSETNPDQIQMLFEVLNGTNTTYEATEGIFATVPSEVKLLDYTTDNTTLTLNFDDHFMTVFESLVLEDATIYANLMVDSLVSSYTSFENIDNVVITVNGEPVTMYYGIDLSAPVSAPRYLNMEPTE